MTADTIQTYGFSDSIQVMTNWISFDEKLIQC